MKRLLLAGVILLAACGTYPPVPPVPTPPPTTIATPIDDATPTATLTPTSTPTPTASDCQRAQAACNTACLKTEPCESNCMKDHGFSNGCN